MQTEEVVAIWEGLHELMQRRGLRFRDVVAPLSQNKRVPSLLQYPCETEQSGIMRELRH